MRSTPLSPRIHSHPTRLTESNAPGVASPPGYCLLWHETEVSVRNVIRGFMGDLVSFELWERRITHRAGVKAPENIVTFNSILKRYYKFRQSGFTQVLDKREERTGHLWRNKPERVHGKWGLDGAEALRSAGYGKIHTPTVGVHPSPEFIKLIDAEQGSISQHTLQFTGGLGSRFASGLPPGITLSEPVTNALSGIYRSNSDPSQIIALYRARRRYNYPSLRLTASESIRDLGILRFYRVGGGVSSPPRIATKNKNVYQPELDESPTIISIVWTDEECIGELSKLYYNQRARLVAQIDNAASSWAKITVRRNDGRELREGHRELVFRVFIDPAGVAETELFDINPGWEPFGSKSGDWLIATVTHDGLTKDSKSIRLDPTPKVIVHFRPHDYWLLGR